MLLSRPTLVDLLKKNAELTLAQALEELGVPLGLMDMDLNPEDFFVVGHRLWEGGQNVAAGGAGTFSEAGIFNQSGGTPQAEIGLVIVEGVSLISAVGERWNAFTHNAGLGAGATAWVRDLRWGFLGRSQHAFITQQNFVPAIGTIIGSIGRKAAADTFTYTAPIVLGPQTTRAFASDTAQHAMDLWAWGRELDLRVR